jgi:hypothetical protein
MVVIGAAYHNRDRSVADARIPAALLRLLLLLLGLRPAQHLAQLVGAGDDRGGVQAPGLA